MNSFERILATIEGKPVDRRPVAPLLSLYGAKLTNCSLDRYYTDSVAYYQGQKEVIEKFDPDILFGPFSLALEGQAFGSEIRFFNYQAPNLAKPAIQSANEIGRLKVPGIESHPINLFFRNSIRKIASEFGKSYPVAAVTLSPVDLPAMILGIDGWLEALMFDKSGYERVLEITIPYFIERANALLADGANFIVLPMAFANTKIVTRKIAIEMTIPVMQTSFAKVKGPIIIHSTGTKLNPFIDLLKDLPNVGGFVLDSQDSFISARNKIGPDPVVAGNIDGPTLYKFTPEEVIKNCTVILQDRKNDPHFILGTSAADINMETPSENILAVKRASAEFV